MSLKKLEEQVTEYRKELKILRKENKELVIHNQFLIDRLETWAERNFQERQKRMNMTVDEVVAMNKDKHDDAQDKELARTWEEQSERSNQVNGLKVANG